MLKFVLTKYSIVHGYPLCELNGHIKSAGFIKIHFEAWSNHISCNNKICLVCQEQMRLKKLCFMGCFSHG